MSLPLNSHILIYLVAEIEREGGIVFNDVLQAASLNSGFHRQGKSQDSSSNTNASASSNPPPATSDLTFATQHGRNTKYPPVPQTTAYATHPYPPPGAGYPPMNYHPYGTFYPPSTGFPSNTYYAPSHYLYHSSSVPPASSLHASTSASSEPTALAPIESATRRTRKRKNDGTATEVGTETSSEPAAKRTRKEPAPGPLPANCPGVGPTPLIPPAKSYGSYVTPEKNSTSSVFDATDVWYFMKPLDANGQILSSWSESAPLHHKPAGTACVRVECRFGKCSDGGPCKYVIFPSLLLMHFRLYLTDSFFGT